MPKVRPIDDFSEFGTNGAFGSSEKVSLFSIDQVVTWARAMNIAVDWSDRTFSITDTSGRTWKTPLHDDWTRDTWGKLLGRVADLKSAYKQLASSPKHRSLSVIAVRDPRTRKMSFFESLTLMFGQTSAVYAFLRFSRAIASVASKLFSLVVVEFFDDFTQLETEELAESAQETLEALIKLIGWELATSESKRKPFDRVFTALGVVVDLSGIRSGEVLLRNKPGRIEGIRAQVDLAMRCKRMGFREALSIRGKLAFAEGQNYGRISAPASFILSRWANISKTK